MAFDAVSVRKQKQDKQSAAIADKKTKVTAIFPVTGITEKGYLTLHAGISDYYAEVFKPKKYDLDRVTLEEADQIEAGSWEFMRQYSASVKEVFLNFPESNKTQQHYFRHLIETTRDPFRLEMLQRELLNMQYLEGHYRKLSSWIWVFGDTVPELERHIESALQYSSVYGFEPTTTVEKQTMLHLMNNPGVIAHEEE